MFDVPADYEKFLSLLEVQKTGPPFFLYAYCLMTNHVHLLIERQADTIGRIMHCVTTGKAGLPESNRWSESTRHILAPLRGAIYLRERFWWSPQTPTTGYFLATLRVETRFSRTIPVVYASLRRPATLWTTLPVARAYL